MINTWEIISGIFTVIFFLAAFYLFAITGVREKGKRGALLFTAVALLGPSFIFDLIGEVYEIEAAEIISIGGMLLAGMLLLISFYLSSKELINASGAG